MLSPPQTDSPNTASRQIVAAPPCGRDERRWVILRPGVQLAAGLPEVETDQGRHSGTQQQPERPNRFVPVGNRAVDEPHEGEERADRNEQPELDLHRGSSPFSLSSTVLPLDPVPCPPGPAWP